MQNLDPLVKEKDPLVALSQKYRPSDIIMNTKTIPSVPDFINENSNSSLTEKERTLLVTAPLNKH